MVKLLALLLSACACFGQAFTLQDTAFLGNAIPKISEPTTFPTNLPNAVSISWWKASDYVTNAGVKTIADSGPGGYTITNTTGGDDFPVNGGTLNGITVLEMWIGGSSSHLRNLSYTSSQPHTVCLIIKDESFDNINMYFFDSCNSGARNYLFSSLGGQPKRMTMDSGTEVYSTYLNTNTWVLVECLFNDASSQMWTNGVSSAAAAAGGSSAINGFTLNGNFNTFNGTKCRFAEAMTYSTAFTAADRNYISNYVRGKYGAGNVVP